MFDIVNVLGNKIEGGLFRKKHKNEFWNFEKIPVNLIWHNSIAYGNNISTKMLMGTKGTFM